MPCNFAKTCSVKNLNIETNYVFFLIFKIFRPLKYNSKIKWILLLTESTTIVIIINIYF